MRSTTEPKYTWLLLQGKTPAQAAFTLLTNGTQLNTQEQEELETMLLEDFIAAVRYKLNYRKGPWLDLYQLIQKTNIDSIHLDEFETKTEMLDIMLYITHTNKSNKN